MKHKVFVLFLLLAAIGLLASRMTAQSCPPPLNLSLDITAGNPPLAHASWSAPPGVPLSGFLLSYSIDGGPTQTLTLPVSPTEYWFPLPAAWRNITLNLASICANGGVSVAENVRKANIVLVDIVLVRSDAPPEKLVCDGACKESTHFFYGSGSGKESDSAPGKFGKSDEPAAEGPAAAGQADALEAFRNTTFCNCMAENGNDFSDPALIAACKATAREWLGFSTHTFNVCNSIVGGRRSTAPAAARPAGAWPNPATDRLQIETGLPEPAGPLRLLLTDLNGNIVLEHRSAEASGSGVQVSIGHLPAGLYIYHLHSGDQQIALGKIIKQ